MAVTPDDQGPTTLEVAVEPLGQAAILSATGEVDMVTVGRLEVAAHRALEDSPPAMVVDLSEVTFLSSAGLKLLVRLHERAGTTTRFGVVAAGPATLRPLQLMGLDQDIAVYPTRADAVTGLDLADPATPDR
ncbi:anti-anti-sigma factor [Herbihabitans rhizosphaerae]|uniref:Anti-anti-sigma factor n=1 Tax=Herbihabitans rhizosphaerae TaxID=1872711 RepID=A0A4Q7KUF6_9PSEU|nr:STAS domain-containing protein [Herbihabitans rhizosphaerae]RZS39112.1 anti-anti-sigma factor [Herbihabitans rhizosphaerae]